MTAPRLKQPVATLVHLSELLMLVFDRLQLQITPSIHA